MLRLSAVVLAAVVTTAVAFADAGTDKGILEGLWPWASQSTMPVPSSVPYEVPTYSGMRFDFRVPLPPLEKAPRVDGDSLFKTVIDCYPSRSQWRLSLDLEARLRTAPGLTEYTGTTIGRSYVGLVGRMPIYSSVELDREREREQRRRADTAKAVASFLSAIAARNRAIRSAALFASMEQRARLRVDAGIADADEQVRFLDKVAAAVEDLAKAEADIMEARLLLVSQCRDDAADAIGQYLARVAQLPIAK